MSLKTTVNFLLICMATAAPQVEAAQTCNTAIAETAPASRFAVNTDQTVKDTLTGLTWKQCAQGLSGAGCATGTATTHTWSEALSLAEAENFAGEMDWRLPNNKELASIVELACVSPAINMTVFPNTPSSFFWSASPSNSSISAWGVYFDFGLNSISFFRSNSERVRLVRGGQ